MSSPGKRDMTVTSDGCGTTHIALRGELDVSSAPALRARIRSALAAGDRTVVLDLSMVPFIDAVALGVLVGGWRRARDAGGDLALAAVTDPVRQVLEMTGLTQLLGAAAPAGALTLPSAGPPVPSSPPPPLGRRRRAC